ncbi:HAMP domain-containing protein [Skermanella mucosa]|uniref:adenylate/guanylate cyclase domain-containing protein n=1 Tax=Skermanella mucosa TaxID=1789672 RepID=UPI00192C2D91|nr:adenylate/guanylate cyclase domain-containing protein [Skermanella mucosa]UEM20348.1 HAMP domain-containing protein [Skermanella mucosa]
MTEAANDAPTPLVAPPAALMTTSPITGQVVGRRRRLRLPIAAVLVAGFGTLMLAAVASVLILGLSSAGRNTFALLNDKADLAIDNVVVRVRHQLDPARDQITYLNGLIESGKLDPDDPEAMRDTLRGALAATPQVTGIGFTPLNQIMTRAGRINGEMVESKLDLSASPDMAAALAEARDRQGPFWVEPVWSPDVRTTLLTVRMGVRRDDRFIGMLIVGVSIGDLSRFLSELYVDEGLSAFVLYGREHVLAHQALRYKEFDFSDHGAGLPLPRIDQVDDPVLASLWRDSRPADTFVIPGRNSANTEVVEIGDDSHLFLLRTLEGYGAQPWTVGINYRLDEVGVEIERLWTTGLVGLGILLVSVGAALWIGRAISRQISRLAAAAASVSALDFRSAPTLPDSRFRELANAADAFNAMVAGLRWFETYVPKGLVLRLIRRSAQGGATSALVSEERQVTVMFTDIRGFSTLAEDLGAAETAALLNSHFTLLATCIEAEGGTVDKFIGDAIMAFWGAPEVQHDHAARALRAARAMALALRADNAKRLAVGLPAVRIRVGLHSGPVVVGNIGSASRINYTIVGDSVNTAARIEELGAAMQGDAEIIVLVGATTAEESGGCVPLCPLGAQSLRGRSGRVEVFRLDA